MATVKYSGPIASFRCPTEAEIRSLKVHFSPKQEGSGDPSPENVREIVGWDGVEVYDYTKTDVNTHIVPDEYKKVEYLEGTGTQYIDTQVPISVISSFNTNWELVFAITSFSKTQIIAGNQNGVKQLPIIGDKMRQDWCGTSASFPTSLGQNAVNILKQNGNSLMLNAESHLIGNEATGDGHFAIFAKFFNISTVETSTIAQMRLYGFTAKTASDVYIAKMIPCIRKSDSKPGLYDTVTKQFFTNAGTGEFLYGPEVSGYTENYEFGVLGKNKLDASTYIDNEYVKSDGTFDANNSFRRTDYLHLSSGDYIYSAVKNDSVPAYSRVCGYTKDKTFVSMLNEQSKTSENYAMTFTVPNNVYYIVLQSYKNASQEQLELGSTATAYDHYDPNHTVYGGWVDLVSGEVAEEWRTMDLGDCTWIHYGQRDSVFYTRTLNNLKVQSAPNTVMSTHYKYEGAPNVTVMNELTISDSQQLNRGNVNICDPNCSEYTVEQFKEAMSGIICAYKAATPNTYHLAPTQLQTFLGHNNVWSNADYVEVEYDLHETQDILARKQFIIANQPHVKQISDTLAHFKTDISAPLKECKVHFNPIQDLHGYDHPWIGGAGRNLFNPNLTQQNPSDATVSPSTARIFTEGTYCVGTSWSNYYIPTNVYTYEVTSDHITVRNGNVYGVGVACKLTSDETYSLSATTTNGRATVIFYDIDGTYISGIANSILGSNFTVPSNADITVINFYGPDGGDAATFTNIQLEKGSTATSYEPYENICPISGWTGMDLYKSSKNLLRLPVMTRTVNGITWTVNEDGSIQVDGTASRDTWMSNWRDDSQHVDFYLKAGTYVLSRNGTPPVASIYFVARDGSTAKDIGQVARTMNDTTFTLNRDTLVGFQAAVASNQGEIHTVIHPQLELLSLTDYEVPNNSVIPITFPSVINMLNSTTITTNKTLSAEGEETSESGMSLTDYIKVNEGDTYKLTFTSKEGARTRRIWSYNANKEPIEQLASVSWVTVDTVGSIQATIPSGAECIRICYKTADENIFLEGPESSVIYGGYIDLVNSELIQTHKMVVYDGSETGWDTYKTSQQMHFVMVISDKKIGLGTSISNCFPNVKNDYFWDYEQYGRYGDHNSLRRIYVNAPYKMPGGVTEWRAYLAEHPMTLVYELETPIEYSLTPAQLKTLKGINNIWSDANGPIEVKYWTH